MVWNAGPLAHTSDRAGLPLVNPSAVEHLAVDRAGRLIWASCDRHTTPTAPCGLPRMDVASPPASRFPWWIPAGGLLLAALYLPTLATPFDFIDDGNLVYPVEGRSLTGHVGLWWERVQANYAHLGPFRPTLWIHWQLQSNLFDGDPLSWRICRLLWTGLAASMFLWLLRELKIHPIAAILAGALAMWNPYRNEIWTSLTLAEGVAMPYALFGLVAARKASTTDRPLIWEIAAAVAVLVALGCKNVFAALVPAQMVLRMWPDGLTIRDAWRRNGWRSLALGVTLLMPAIHFVHYKTHWHPGQYETPGPSLAQFGRLLNTLKGAMSPEFMGVGVVLAAITVGVSRRTQLPDTSSAPEAKANRNSARPALACAIMLLLGGVAMYLPVTIISGRYSMPAVWGLDILFGLLLTAFVAAPVTVWKKAAWGGVCAGIAVVAAANIGRQEKFAARATMLWVALHYVEANAPLGAKVAWMSGDSLKGALNVEEGIHFQWHLYHRGRGDVRIGLFDESGAPLERTELQPLDGPPQYALAGQGAVGPGGFEPVRKYAAAYWYGWKHYDWLLSRKPVPGFHDDATHRAEVGKLFQAMLQMGPPAAAVGDN